MNLNIYNSIILIGLVQALVFTLVWIFRKKYHSVTTTYLITLILSYSLSNLQWYLLDVNIISEYQFYNYFYLPWSLITPTLLLGYGLKLIHKKKKLPSYFKYLFLPFALGLLLALYYKVRTIFWNIEINIDTFYEFFPYKVELFSAVGNLMVLGILYGEFQKIKVENPHHKWFYKVVIVFFFTTLIWIYTEVRYLYKDENIYFYPLWILISFAVYWLGYVGMYKYGVTQERDKIKAYAKANYTTTNTGNKDKNEEGLITEVKHYLITERHFLNPELSLSLLAKELNVSISYLSKQINTKIGSPFKEYVNALRIAEAKRYLQHPDFRNYTIVAIGLEAGFNSKSAFNASFKKITGMSPSEYRKKKQS